MLSDSDKSPDDIDVKDISTAQLDFHHYMG